MSTSSARAPSSRARTSCCAQRNACERAAALGRPVVPVVKVMSAGASAATCAAAGAGPRAAARASGKAREGATSAIGTARSAGLTSRSR